jgi:hypothetical protein
MAPTIIRDPELAAVRAELQRASACLIRIEELLNKPIGPVPPRVPPPKDWHNYMGGGIPRNPSPPDDMKVNRRASWWSFW